MNKYVAIIEYWYTYYYNNVTISSMIYSYSDKSVFFRKFGRYDYVPTEK